MSLNKLIKISDDITNFEILLTTQKIPLSSTHVLDLHIDELKLLWESAKKAYEGCMEEISGEQVDEDEGKPKLKSKTKPSSSAGNQVEAIRGKYDSVYITYCNCFAKLHDLRNRLTPSAFHNQSLDTSSVAVTSSGFKLPACDTPPFYGDYTSWPSFRDSFSATFIQSNLSPIQKLLHLRQRTKGEAYDIVSKFPLEDSGFDLAWSALKDRFENKRILVNGQIRRLFELKSITSESSQAIESFQREINSCLSNLKMYQIETSSWDPILVYFCSSKLPVATLTLWEHTLVNKSAIPQWKDLSDFLTNRYRTLESVSETRNRHSNSSENTQNLFQKQKPIKTFQTQVKPPNCPLCPQVNHFLKKCHKFNKMDPRERFNELKKFKLCINCFSKAHTAVNCTSKYSCTKCDKKHHTLLHWEPEVVKTHFSSHATKVLLGTARVQICYLDTRYEVRALIDSGSEGCFISERLFNRLKLPFSKTNVQISGLNNTVSAECHKQCTLVLSSTLDQQIQVSISAVIVSNLSGNLPSYPISKSFIDSMPALRLADPEFHNSSKVDLLLGGNIFPSIMLQGCRSGVCGSLLAQETIFGWILTGPVIERSSDSTPTTMVSFHCGVSLKDQISRFWAVENLPRKNFHSESEKACERMYVKTTTRNKDGRYVVSLPFKERFGDSLLLGYSRSSALAQFLRNEKRLIRNLELKVQYDKVLQEYLELGHMTEIPSDSHISLLSNYYLPHHAVIKAESTTTKVRVVFNASSATSNGLSLNDVLHTGPALQADLILLLHKWRFYKYVFNADIQQMYRQILVQPDNRNFQRIFYRSNPNEPIKEYSLNTVTFGVNCAPYLAIRTILQLADDVSETFPLASKILRSNMYVDDVLAGFHSIETANKAKHELIRALNSAGFMLRKWTSNQIKILKDLPSTHLLHKDFLEFEGSSMAKTLGIRWNARSDTFFFMITHFSDANSFTKRQILSDIAKLFDPAGWLSPCIVLAKIIMQRIWSEQTGWDEPVSDDILKDWRIFQASLTSINSISIPRWINYSPNCRVEFHGFCDASEKAYAACVYIRFSYPNKVESHLICSKTKVAPIKTLSIPRLELCGALLLAELIDNIVPNLEVSQHTIICWTDSTIVRSWLSKPPATSNTFVAHRIATIIEIVDPKYWFHVKSEDNPADLASRGAYPSDLLNNNLWWHGPKWLQERTQSWISASPVLKTELERRSIKCHSVVLEKHDDILQRFSYLPRALRCIAYVYRFFLRTHPFHKKNTYFPSIDLSSKEIQESQTRLIVMYQKIYFPKEYLSLLDNKEIPSSSSILNLNPFMTKESILRCGGRLDSAPGLNYNDKHPIILPYGCYFVRLLVRFTHDITLHGGNQLVLRMIRSQYWIPRVKNIIKSTINHCKPCILYKKRCQRQLMSALPSERTEISRPFCHTGLDFAGPFDIKSFSGRNCRITKGYVCIFVCFSTKAIHLEATSDLSTAAFLSAFQRFISRRGCPNHIHSDNGTNFVGASKILAKEFLLNSKRAIENKYAHQHVLWHFIPPGAPHMGGLWEAGVKSFKSHILKLPGPFKYTYEEFSTLLSQIEACLNSRPLSPQSQDPSDLSAITPGHFLTGGPILSPLASIPDERPMSIVNRWQRLKAIHRDFCIRWKNEYLKELHKRNKWKNPFPNLQLDDLVVVKEYNLPPNNWRLGRVTKVHMGKDNLVRVVDVRTQRGTITRPIAKLILLPFEQL